MRAERTAVGTLLIVQVQRSPLKTGEGDRRHYDPAPLVRVPMVEITRRGIIGVLENGERILDAHHADHPQSRFGGSNGISVGFTANYDLLRAEFGAHFHDGLAGENLIVAGAPPNGPDLAGGRLLIENPDRTRVALAFYKAMAPCREFSRFVHQARQPLPAEVLKETLQFLGGGRRGYAMVLDGEEHARVAQGAQVFFEPL